MDYERAYKAVLKTATQWIKDGCSDKEKVCLESVFPELRESEDESIRKSIADCVSLMGEDDDVFSNHNVTKVQVLAWLEKQKINTEGDFGRGYDCGYEACLNSHGAEWLEKQKEQKPELPKPHKGDDTNPYDMPVSEAQEYAIKRGFGVPFNDGEVYVDERHITQTIGNILRWADEHPKEQKPVEPSDEELQRHQDELYDFKVFATKQAREHHISFVHDFEWNNFCAELLSYFNEKQKPVDWSEEDENMRNNILRVLSAFVGTVECESNPSLSASYLTYSREIAWLKSLRPQGSKDSLQTHWKPREEQMYALEGLISRFRYLWDDDVRKSMESLYEQLKNL